jgi:hypothetical protein
MLGMQWHRASKIWRIFLPYSPYTTSLCHCLAVSSLSCLLAPFRRVSIMNNFSVPQMLSSNPTSPLLKHWEPLWGCWVFGFFLPSYCIFIFLIFSLQGLVNWCQYTRRCSHCLIKPRCSQSTKLKQTKS